MSASIKERYKKYLVSVYTLYGCGYPLEGGGGGFLKGFVNLTGTV
jgi:hypothetical protein